MTLTEFASAMRERWRLLLCGVLLGLAAAATLFGVSPVQYTSTFSLYVSAQQGIDPQQAFQAAQLSAQRVKSYTELITSPRVTQNVIDTLGLPENPDQLADQITAASSSDSVLIEVEVTSSTALQAQSIAQSVSGAAIRLVDELERPSSPIGIAPVSVQAVSQPSMPTEPSSPGLLLMLAAGAVIGTILGIAAALIREVSDGRVRTPSDAATATNSPEIGSISYWPEGSQGQSVVQASLRDARSEQYRRLRTNVQFLSVDSKQKILTITSPNPNEGKSTTTINLAYTLGISGFKVIIVEADLRRPTLSTTLGLDRAVGLSRIISGQVDTASAIQKWGDGSFDVIASGPTPPNPSELLGSNSMRHILDDLRQKYDYVLVDTPPVLAVIDAAAIAASSDGAIVVVRSGSTSRNAARETRKALDTVGARTLGVVLNMAPERDQESYGSYGYEANDGAGTKAAKDISPPTVKLRSQRH